MFGRLLILGVTKRIINVLSCDIGLNNLNKCTVKQGYFKIWPVIYDFRSYLLCWEVWPLKHTQLDTMSSSCSWLFLYWEWTLSVYWHVKQVLSHSMGPYVYLPLTHLVFSSSQGFCTHPAHLHASIMLIIGVATKLQNAILTHTFISYLMIL